MDVLVVPCNDAVLNVPLLSFAPEYCIGAVPKGRGIPGVDWYLVTPQGIPLARVDEPLDSECHVADLILFRLAQAYTALVVASTPSAPPSWKA